MKSRLRIVSGLAALAALFLAPLADASLTRVSTAERAIEAPTLTLASPAAAPEPSEFSLFDGTEIARAAAESESAPSFHPLTAVSLLSKNEAEAPLVSIDELIYPKTRYRVFDFLGAPLIGVERGVSLELQWGSSEFKAGLASGAVGWLSQDPLGDKDSPNLYGFVGMRPHEKTDPLGLMTSWRAEVGPGDVLPTVDVESGNGWVDATVLATLNTAVNLVGGAVNTVTNLLYVPQRLGEEGLRKVGWTDTDIEALKFYAMANPAEVAAGMNSLRLGASQASAQLSRLLQRMRQAKSAAPAPVLRSVGAAANKEFQTLNGPRFSVGPDGTTVDNLPLAKSGEDLFIGSYGESAAANRSTGLSSTHSPHHAVADVISPSSTYRGVTINLEKRLHGLTRTFRRNPVRGTPYELREQLHQDVENIRQVLLKDGYDRDQVERALNELVRQNSKVYGLQ